MIETIGYAARSAKQKLSPFSFQRRDLGPKDVHIEILYCGVCHSDLHTARDEWGGTMYPCVPGHEIIGRVSEVGAEVKRFKKGDLAGVGCMVDTCRDCGSCKDGQEQYCETGFILTYNSEDYRHGGGVTYGGYSNHIVVDEHFVLTIPAGLEPSTAGPLLCAGITTYSPLRHWKVAKGSKVGIIGLGGLGHMGVKFADAFGAHVVLFTTSPDKKDDAIRLGADEVVISKNSDEMAKHANSFDFILDTVSARHDINAYLELLKLDATLTQVGVPSDPLEVAAFSLIMRRRSLAGSLIGGIRETQEMLNFCAEHKIGPDVEMIPIQKINEAYERMLRSDVKYRFVIDMKSLKQ